RRHVAEALPALPMLTAIGYHVELKLASGRLIHPRGVMLYDFTGRDWPKSSVLIGNKPEGHLVKPTKSRWFGVDSYHALKTAPYEIIPGTKNQLLSLDNWNHLGEIKSLKRYERGLEHPDRWISEPQSEPDLRNPKGAYHHSFQDFEA